MSILAYGLGPSGSGGGGEIATLVEIEIVDTLLTAQVGDNSIEANIEEDVIGAVVTVEVNGQITQVIEGNINC